MAKILLVEDDTLLRNTLGHALQAAGHLITPAQNGVVAQKMIRDTTFDLVVTDVLMPEMDGLELIMSLRKANAGIKVIAISGGGRTRNMDMLEYARSFGADAVLPKPFLPRQLVATVRDLLGTA